MEKKTVFIKVKIDDIHIGVYDKYFKPNGDTVFGVVYLEKTTCLWKCLDKDGSSFYVTHALKELPIFSEEDVKNTDFNKEDCDYRDIYKEIGFRQGLTFFIKYLKGE